MLSLALLAPGKRCLSVTTTLVLRAKMSPRLSRPSFFRRKIGQTSVSPTFPPNKRKSFLNQHKKSETRNTKHLGKGAFHGGLRNRGEASCERQHYSVVRKWCEWGEVGTVEVTGGEGRRTLMLLKWKIGVEVLRLGQWAVLLPVWLWAVLLPVCGRSYYQCDYEQSSCYCHYKQSTNNIAVASYRLSYLQSGRSSSVRTSLLTFLVTAPPPTATPGVCALCVYIIICCYSLLHVFDYQAMRVQYVVLHTYFRALYSREV